MLVQNHSPSAVFSLSAHSAVISSPDIWSKQLKVIRCTELQDVRGVSASQFIFLFTFSTRSTHLFLYFCGQTGYFADYINNATVWHVKGNFEWTLFSIALMCNSVFFCEDRYFLCWQEVEVCVCARLLVSLICEGSAVMSSNQGSSPIPQSSGRGGGTSDGLFRKPRDPSMAPRHYRTQRSLPDVCPKEPTGERSFPVPLIKTTFYIFEEVNCNQMFVVILFCNTAILLWYNWYSIL